MTRPPVEDNSTDENQVQDMLLTYLLDGENKRSKQRHKKDPGTALVWTFSNRKNAVGYCRAYCLLSSTGALISRIKNKHKKQWDEAKHVGDDQSNEKKMRIDGYLRPASVVWNQVLR